MNIFIRIMRFESFFDERVVFMIRGCLSPIYPFFIHILKLFCLLQPLSYSNFDFHTTPNFFLIIHVYIRVCKSINENINIHNSLFFNSVPKSQ
jgi:hypothetical protein